MRRFVLATLVLGSPCRRAEHSECAAEAPVNTAWPILHASITIALNLRHFALAPFIPDLAGIALAPTCNQPTLPGSGSEMVQRLSEKRFHQPTTHQRLSSLRLKQPTTQSLESVVFYTCTTLYNLQYIVTFVLYILYRLRIIV